MGREWLKALRSSTEADLVGVVDLDLDAARRAAEECGYPNAPVSTSLTALLDGLDADAVLNVTVPAAHRAVSDEALSAGLPVLVEKPLAETVSQGLAMIAAAEQSGQLLMVSQSRRYSRQLTAFRRQIAAIGSIGMIECEFFKAPHFGGFREQMAYPLLVDMAIHQFDLARDLTGGDPVSVFCESFNPAWSWYDGDAAARVSFEMTNGVRFGFAGSWCSPGLETSWNGSWRVSAADGTARWDGDNLPVSERADGRTIEPTVDEVSEGIRGSLHEFVESVREGGSPSGAADRNLLSLAMVEAAIRSAELDRRVELREVLDEAYLQACENETQPAIASVLRRWGSAQSALGRP